MMLDILLMIVNLWVVNRGYNLYHKYRITEGFSSFNAKYFFFTTLFAFASFFFTLLHFMNDIADAL